MKTILRILDILLVAAVVAAAFSLAVGNMSAVAGQSESSRLPVMTNTAGQSVQPMERPEGGRDGGSMTGGLLEVLATVVKLAGITILVLLIQKAFRLLRNARSIPIKQ